MTLPPMDPWPRPGERGRVTSDLDSTLAATVAAWDDLLDAVEGVDLDLPARKAGRTAARTLVVLGSWPEGRPLASILRAAREGDVSAEALESIEARVIAAHVADPPERIFAALRRARDETAAWADSPDVSNEALLPVGGPLGVVPLGTLVAAAAYQCAVAARDLQPAGVRSSDRLVDHGLHALIDTVGAVAAQQGATVALTVVTPGQIYATHARSGNWHTQRRPGESGHSFDGPTLACEAGLLLDIASGRASAPAAYARGQLAAHDLPGLLAVAQVLSRASGLPGTEGLRAALNAYTSSAAAARAVGDALGGAWRRLRGS